MTTTRNQTQGRRKPAPKPPMSPTMRRWRPKLSVISFILLLFAGFHLALNLGKSRPMTAAIVEIAIALALMIAAQVPALYEWADKEPAPLLVEHADQAPPKPAKKQRAPKQRTREQDAPGGGQLQFPTVKPAWDLGAEFRYMILFGRTIAENRPELIERMEAFWDDIDWNDIDWNDADIDPYREAVEHVYDLVRADPRCREVDVTFEQMLAGDVADTNPFPFIVEVESYHMMIGAMAALMLVLDDPNLDDADRTIMGPWIELGLPYRIGNTVHKAGPDGVYQTEQVPGPKPARPAAEQAPAATPAAAVVADGSVPPAGTLEDMLAVLTPDQQAAPAAVPARAEPDHDDVEDPSTQLILRAADLVITSQLGSDAMIQRKLRIGTVLTAKIMHRLHQLGVVGKKPADGGARDVLVEVHELADTIDFIKEKEAERRKG